ncbi:uncharacterized protein Dwil_GK24396 [Drosophila willistoni]|uniref:C2H2-type domain-containing protein n=1 Tax=Drosophila willistoni TaxID=7260 RepID=B4N0W8_DROWI|nr:uncharacterized protein LOC6644399 isoform X1 [Drosophila willistoni]EDW77731.2 uncharacterized protein Dwil_GK24396 [Drosophila willistoni]
MSPKYHHFEFALIYFLLLIPWPTTNVIKILCSRDNSRLVRKIVRSKWTPILDKHQVKLPMECPLHPFRDIFAPRQDSKQRDRPTQWTCRRCGKSFYQEKYLDLHFDIRHETLINEVEDSICLSDFCDIMRCDVFQTEDATSLKFGDQHIVTDIEVWGEFGGQNSALAKANAAYLSLIPRTSTLGTTTRAAKVQNRQLLQDKPSQTINDQSPAGGPTVGGPSEVTASADDGSASRPKSAGEKLLRKLKELGQAHLRRGDNENEAKGDPAKTNGLPNASGEEAEEEKDEEHSGNEENGSGQEQQQDASKTEDGNASARARANCKPEELNKLKISCEHLLRSCIGGLLLSMSDQAFKEMEEEMNKAVCWYLTCDRYWEDGPLEPRAFPWGLIVILIFVLSTGICFCYYIIWILFDSEETTINTTHYGGGLGINNTSSSIYMPGAHHHHYQHVDYVTHRDLQPLDDVGGIPGLTVEQQQQLQREREREREREQQAYYYRDQASARDLYPESVQYHHHLRHSPRHYITSGDQRQAGVSVQGTGTPTASGGVRQVQATSSSSNANTPLHHHHPQHRHSTSLAYPQDILDRRDYTSSSGYVASTSAAGDAPRHYNTHPRPLDTRHRHVGSSQQSLRASSSTHEIVQGEMVSGAGGLSQNEHYIYVTYPPDLNKRYFDKYE